MKTIKCPSTRDQFWSIIDQSSAVGLTYAAYILPTMRQHLATMKRQDAKRAAIVAHADNAQWQVMTRHAKIADAQKTAADLSRLDSATMRRFFEMRGLSRIAVDITGYAYRMARDEAETTYAKARSSILDAFEDANGYRQITREVSAAMREAEKSAEIAHPLPPESIAKDAPEQQVIAEIMREAEDYRISASQAYQSARSHLMNYPARERGQVRRMNPAYIAKQQKKTARRMNSITGGWYSVLMGDTITPAVVAA